MEDLTSIKPEKLPSFDSEKLDRLLDQLSPDTTDEEKFASLLVLSKAVDTEDAAQMDKLFTRLNFRFLDRLLRQGIKGVKRPEKEGETLPKDSMVAIAVNILTPFFYQPNRCSSDILLMRLPLLVANLECKEEGVTCAILRSCLLTSTTLRGAQFVVCAKVPGTENTILQRILARCQKEGAIRIGNGKDENSDVALQIFERVGITLLHSKIDDASKIGTKLIEFLELFVESMCASNDEVQFKLIDILVAWYDGFSVQAQAYLPGELVPTAIWLKLHQGLQKLLQAPSRSAPRAKALHLCSLLTRYYGFGWLVSHEGAFPSLLLRLAAIEVRVGLEEVNISIEGDSNFLMAGLEFLIHATNFLVLQPEVEGPPNFAIPPLEKVGLVDKNLPQVLLWLRETNKDCLYFLADQKEDDRSNPLLLVGLQFVCIYLAEDSGLFQDADSQSLPLGPFFAYLAWCFSQASSLESVNSLGLVSPHGANLLLQACECGGELIDLVQQHASVFISGLMNYILSVLGQPSSKITHDLVAPQIPTLLPALRAIASILDNSQNESSDPKLKMLFSNIYQVAQEVLDEKGPL